MESDCSSHIKTLASSPLETCGYVLDDWSLILIKNSSPVPFAKFLFDTTQQANAVADSRDRIIGMFHTHPSGTDFPSQHDLEGWPMIPQFRYWIGTIRNVAEWSFDGNKATRLWNSDDPSRKLVSSVHRTARRL